MITSKHINSNPTIFQFVEEHFLCSVERIEVDILSSIKCITKNKKMLNPSCINSRKESIVIKFFEEI